MQKFKINDVVQFEVYNKAGTYQGRVVDVEDHAPFGGFRYGLEVLGQSPFIIPQPYLWEYELTLVEEPYDDCETREELVFIEHGTYGSAEHQMFGDSYLYDESGA